MQAVDSQVLACSFSIIICALTSWKAIALKSANLAPMVQHLDQAIFAKFTLALIASSLPYPFLFELLLAMAQSASLPCVVLCFSDSFRTNSL